MPPIPASFDNETTQMISGIARRQRDVAEFQLTRLRTCKGPLAVQQNLAAELREDLETIMRQIEGLELLVGDQKSRRDRTELQRAVDDFKATLSTLKRDSRTALLESKRAIDSMSKSNRDELLKSSAVTQKSEEKSAGDALMKANNDVTEALRRTIGVMQGELEKSVLSTQMLESSTASLRSTSATHDTLTNVMGASKQLLTALEKSDWLDRIVLISALVFFFMVVLFIVKQRVVDKSLRVAFWWTRFIPDFGGDEALLAVEDGLKAATGITAASTLAAASATVSSIAIEVSSNVAPPPPSQDSIRSEILQSILVTEDGTDLPVATPSDQPNLDLGNSGDHDEL